MYKTRSDRLERWNRSTAQGFRKDIAMIRDKVINVEKVMLQVTLCYKY